MFDNILKKPDAGETLSEQDFAAGGFLTPKQYHDLGEPYTVGSIVDVVVEDEGYKVYRVVLGKLTVDLWDEADQYMLLRWPDVFREDYMTVYGIRLIEPAKTIEEAVDDLFEFFRSRVTLSEEDQEAFKNKLSVLSARSAVSSVDWDSSSLYC